MRSHDNRDYDDPMVVNIHDRCVAERMPIHEARTEAELGSRVVRHARVIGTRRLRVVRSDVRRIA